MKSASRWFRYTYNVPYFSGDINILHYVVNIPTEGSDTNDAVLKIARRNCQEISHSVGSYQNQHVEDVLLYNSRSALAVGSAALKCCCL
jgi:hypothetical protein